MPTPTKEIPLDDEHKSAWETRIKEARACREQYEPLWSTNLKRTYPPPDKLEAKYDRYDVNTNIDFRQVEQKKNQLFFQLPQVQLTADEPIGTQLADAILIHQAVLNKILGPKQDGGQVGIKRCMQRNILDVLCPAGWGPAKLGYRQTTVEVKQKVPVITDTGVMTDPETGDIIESEETIPVPIYAEYFCARFSPWRLLAPKDFDSVDFDEAPWIGMEFSMPLFQARREFHLPDDFEGTTQRKIKRLGDDSDPGKTEMPMVEGVELWYMASLFDPDAIHPLLIRELILLDGLDRPARHRNCEYQTFDEQGRLTNDSLVGYPIDVMTSREVPDSSYVPSDSAMTRRLADELNTYRGQNLRQRDAATGCTFFDESKIAPETVEQMKEGSFNKVWVPIEEGQLDPSHPPVLRAEMPTLPRDNYTGQDYIERDIERTLALGSNQTGQVNRGRRTAAEVSIAQGNTDARLGGEQDRVTDCFLRRVRKIDQLVQRYTSIDRDEVIKYVGPNGEQRYAPWDKTTIAGKFLYTIKPDSQLRVDQAADQQRHLNLYNLTANDQNANRVELLRAVFQKFGLDPTKFINPPPPPPGPPPPNVSVKVAVADLDPRQPWFPFALKIMQAAGYQFDQTDMQIASMLAKMATEREIQEQAAQPVSGGPARSNGGQAPHGGAATPTTPISKHAADRTGELSGPGPLLAALGPGAGGGGTGGTAPAS